MRQTTADALMYASIALATIAAMTVLAVLGPWWSFATVAVLGILALAGSKA